MTLAKDGLKHCPRCVQTYPVARFSRNQKQPDGLQSHCKTCHTLNSKESRQHDPSASREAHARWRAKNPNASRERSAKWRAENQDAVKADGVLRRIIRLEAPGRGVPKKVWEQIVTAWGGTCGYCSDAPATEQDHVVPLSAGGAHDVLNVVPACKPCNMQKGGRPPEEWAPFDLKILARLVHDIAAKLDLGLTGSRRANARLPPAGSYIAVPNATAPVMPPTNATFAVQGLKHCWRCKEVKPFAEFGKLTRSADGLNDRCRACNLEAYYDRPKIEPPAEKHCSGCKEAKPIAEFGVNKAQPDGRHHYCFACTKARRPSNPKRVATAEEKLTTRRVWAETNREKLREADKARRAANPEKASAAQRRYVEKNAAKLLEGHRLRRAAHSPEQKARTAELARAWKEAHPVRAREHVLTYTTKRSHAKVPTC